MWDIIRPFFKMEEIEIRQGDWKDLIKDIPNNSIDCVITDPPYNVLALNWEYKVNWKMLSKELFRVLKENGSMYVFCQMPVGFEIFRYFSKHFDFRQDLIWLKNRGICLTKTSYMRVHENILFFVKRQNYKVLIDYLNERRKKKKLSLNDINKHFGMATNGGGCASQWMGQKERNTLPTEEQYVELKKFLDMDNRFDDWFTNKRKESHTFNFDDIKETGKSYYRMNRSNPKIYGKKSDMGSYESVNKGYRHPKSILKYDIIQSGNEYMGHPTQKPIKLIRHLIKASTSENDLVLDCFAGSGTTLVACQELKRRGVGFEKETEYITLTNKRLNQKNLHHFTKSQIKQDTGGENGKPVLAKTVV